MRHPADLIKRQAYKKRLGLAFLDQVIQLCPGWEAIAGADAANAIGGLSDALAPGNAGAFGAKIKGHYGLILIGNGRGHDCLLCMGYA